MHAVLGNRLFHITRRAFRSPTYFHQFPSTKPKAGATCGDVYEVQLGTLRKDHLSIQRQFHPDKFVTRTSEERELAARESAYSNHAYQVVRDPLKRAKYMLELLGDPVGEDDHVSNHEFLSFVFEMRERIAELNDRCEAGKCAATDIAALVAELREMVGQRTKEVQEQFRQVAFPDEKERGVAVNAGNPPKSPDSDRLAAKNSVVALQYLVNLRDAAERISDHVH